jgi:hypothetical protein
MANVRLANAAQQAAMDAVVDLIDSGGAGTINIYSGTQPTTANDAVGAGTLLATLTYSATAFGDASTSGVATAASITGDSSADATGTAAWARVLNGSAATVFDCDVGTSGATINLNTVSIVAGGAVDITSMTMTHPDGT